MHNAGKIVQFRSIKKVLFYVYEQNQKPKKNKFFERMENYT